MASSDCSWAKRWKPVSDPLVLQGQWQHHFEDQVEELAMTIAAGLDAQIF